jgi:hypothetical protein
MRNYREVYREVGRRIGAFIDRIGRLAAVMDSAFSSETPDPDDRRRIRGWPQNPPAYGLTSSSLVPGISDVAPGISPPDTGENTGKPGRVATFLRLRQIERDRLLGALRRAARSGDVQEWP